MKALQNTLLAVSGVTAALPGVTALTSAVSVPPGDAKLFGAIATVVSSLVIGTVWFFRRELASRRNTLLLLVSVAGGSLGVYLFLFQTKVFRPEPGYEFLLPLWIGPSLQFLLSKRKGSIAEVFNDYGPDELRSAIALQPAAVACSRFSLLLAYVAFFAAIVASIVLVAIRINSYAGSQGRRSRS